MRLRCQNCSSQIRGEGINVQELVAKCGRCHHVFRFDPTEIGNAGKRGKKQTSRSKGDKVSPALPKRITVRRVDAPSSSGGYRQAAGQPRGELHITRKWFSISGFFLLFFACMWNAFLVFWYVNAFKDGNLVMMLFPLLHVAAGIFITYLGLAQLINKTEFTLTGDSLSVRHHPLPWRGNKTLATDRVSQLFIRKHINRRNSSNTRTFEVYAATKDDEEIPLVKRLGKRDEALAIENLIEDFLDIEDDASFDRL